MSDQLSVELIVEAISRGFDQAGDKFKGLGKAADEGEKGIGRLDKAVTKLATVGYGALLVGGAAATKFLYDGVVAAAEAEKGHAALAQTLETAGDKTNITAGFVDGLSTNLSRLTGVEDDAITAGQNMLIQMGVMSDDVLPRAAEAALDLSVKTGNVTGSFDILGRVLGDFDGFTKLEKQGIHLTDAERELAAQFKATGDMAGYQNLVLDAVAGVMGGQAAAAASTLTGKMTILKNEFGNIQENLGTALLPALNDLSDEAMPAVFAISEDVAGLFADKLAPAVMDGVDALKELEDAATLDGDFDWVQAAGNEIDKFNLKLLKVQGYLEMIGRPNAARWELGMQLAEVDQNAENAAEAVEGYRVVLERFDVQQATVNQEVERGKEEFIALSGAYDYMIPQVERLYEVVTRYNATTAESIAILSGYEPQLAEVEGMVADYRQGVIDARLADEQWASVMEGITSSTLPQQFDALDRLHGAYANLDAAQLAMAESPWSSDLIADADAAETEVQASLDAITTGYEQMVLDMIIADAGGVFSEDAAQFAIASGLMTTALANERVAAGLLVNEELPRLYELSKELTLTDEELTTAIGLLSGGMVHTAEAAAYMASESGQLAIKIGESRDRTRELQAALEDTAGNYDVGINVSVTGDPIPNIPGQGGYPGGGPPQPMAAGGLVTGGIPGRDSVPAMLMPGERVLSVEDNRLFERLLGALGNQRGGPTFNLSLSSDLSRSRGVMRDFALMRAMAGA